MTMQLLKKTVLTTFLLLLTACGFQLRGQYLPLPASFNHIYINAQNDRDPLVSDLTDQLKQRTQLVDKAQAANYVIDISNIRRDRFTPTINTSNQLADVQLTYSATITLLDKQGKEILPSQNFSVRSNVTTNVNEMLAANRLEDDAFQTLQQQLIGQIMHWLTAQNTKQAITGHHETQSRTTR